MCNSDKKKKNHAFLPLARRGEGATVTDRRGGRGTVPKARAVSRPVYWFYKIVYWFNKIGYQLVPMPGRTINVVTI